MLQMYHTIRYLLVYPAKKKKIDKDVMISDFRWFWFRFNTLELALFMALKSCKILAKRLKLKVRIFLRLIRTSPPFSGAYLAQQRKTFNDSMAKFGVSVEWLFGIFISNSKLGLSNVVKLYGVSALLVSTHKSLYRNNCTDYFDLDPPTLE